MTFFFRYLLRSYNLALKVPPMCNNTQFSWTCINYCSMPHSETFLKHSASTLITLGLLIPFIFIFHTI